jgi:hypothetical protein
LLFVSYFAARSLLDTEADTLKEIIRKIMGDISRLAQAFK